MSLNFSEERKNNIADIGRRPKSKTQLLNMSFSAINKYKMNPGLRARLAEVASKPVILYMRDDITIHSKYKSIKAMSKIFKCCHKTINKSIKNNTLFKNIGKIK